MGTRPIVRIPEEAPPAPGVVIRAKLREPREPGSSLRECRAEEFDAGERGISMGPVTIPWHRVLEYRWLSTQPFESAPETISAAAQIRVVVEDGTAGGLVHTVSPQMFEAGPWTLTLILDRRVHPEYGLETMERLFLPWHRVREYERVPVDAAQTPGALEGSAQR